MSVPGLEGNKIVASTGAYPLVNNHFMLRVEGLYDLPCKRIMGFQKDNEYEYIQEGGLNDYVHLRRKPISRPFQFQVERYVGSDYFDPMPNGAELILPVLLMISRYSGGFGRTKRTYAFTGCTVMGKNYGEMNAESSGLLVETTTIAYRELICIDTPADDLDNTFSFTDIGNDVRNNRTIQKKAHFQTDSGKPEIGKNQMAEQAKYGDTLAQRIWPVKKSAKNIEIFLNR